MSLTKVIRMLVATLLLICVLSSKRILIYNEEIIVALCFILFLLFCRKSFGETFKVTLDTRIQAIKEELQQFLNPKEVVSLESQEQLRSLRIRLRICGILLESLPIARCAPKCEKTVQALLCRNLSLKLATLLHASDSHRSGLQDDLGARFQRDLSLRFRLFAAVPFFSDLVLRPLVRESLVELRDTFLRSGARPKSRKPLGRKARS